MSGSPGSPGDYEVQIIKMLCPGCREEVEVEVKIRLIATYGSNPPREALDFEYKVKHGEHGGHHTLHRIIFEG